jgi:hypothetical protein
MPFTKTIILQEHGLSSFDSWDISFSIRGNNIYSMYKELQAKACFPTDIILGLPYPPRLEETDIYVNHVPDPRNSLFLQINNMRAASKVSRPFGLYLEICL